MSTKQTEALKLALEALEAANKHHNTTSLPLAIKNYGSREACAKAGFETWLTIVPHAITAIREALAEQPAQQQEQEQEQEKDWDAVGQAHLAALKKSSKKLVEEAAVRAVHKMAQQQEPVAWADDCRIELVTAIHFITSDYENALGAFGEDVEARRKAEGDIAHARKIASKWNWNGRTSPPASKPWVGLTMDEITKLWDEIIKYAPGDVRLKDFAYATEAKLREKNA